MIYRISNYIELNPIKTASLLAGFATVAIWGPETILARAILGFGVSFVSYQAMNALNKSFPPSQFDRAWHLAKTFQLVSLEMRSVQVGLNQDQKAQINTLFGKSAEAVRNGSVDAIRNKKSVTRPRNKTWF